MRIPQHTVIHDNVYQCVSNLALHCGRENILSYIKSEYKPYLSTFLCFFAEHCGIPFFYSLIPKNISKMIEYEIKYSLFSIFLLFLLKIM